MTTAARRRKKSRRGRWIVGGLLFVLVFAVGIALGQALEDNPHPASTITQDQTLSVPQASATVTVTAP